MSLALRGPDVQEDCVDPGVGVTVSTACLGQSSRVGLVASGIFVLAFGVWGNDRAPSPAPPWHQASSWLPGGTQMVQHLEAANRFKTFSWPRASTWSFGEILFEPSMTLVGTRREQSP